MKAFNLVCYTADLWEHVCPTLRLTAPAEIVGANIIRGSEWKDGVLETKPELAAEGDVIVIQRDFPRHIQDFERVIKEARRLKKPVVYELDDLLSELPPEHPDFFSYLPSQALIVRAMIEADAVIGSTSELCEYARQFNPNVKLFPNYLCDQYWRVTPHPGSSAMPLIMGYMGGHSHAYDLEMIVPALEKLLDRYADRVILKFWGLTPPEAIRQRKNVETIIPGLVNYREFAAYFSDQKCDLFIAPLADNLFNRCKSHLKFLEYSSAAVPGVYSYLTPYASIISHGKNGYLAATLDEWETYLIKLIEETELRLRMGSDAQDIVSNQWRLSTHASRWLDIYREFAAIQRHVSQHEKTLVTARKLSGWHYAVTQELLAQREAHLKLQTDTISLEKTINGLKSQLATQDQAIQSLNSKIAESEQSLNLLQGQMLEKDRDIQDLQIQLVERDLHLKGLKDRLTEGENTIAALETQDYQTRQVLNEVLNSRSWRIARKFQSVRLYFIPKDGKIERNIKKGLLALRILRDGGFQALFQVIRQGQQKKISLAGNLRDQAIATPSHQAVGLSISDSTPIQFPAISLILIKDPAKETLNEQTVLDWLDKQTLPQAAEFVIWERTSKQAWRHSQPDSKWDAPTFSSLKKRLESRYICNASLDLLAQNQTYLETNLIALESEELAFTVNLCNDAQWAMKYLGRGFLPGDQTNPMLRQLIAKTCLSDNLEVDISEWLDKTAQRAEIIGAILHHTTNSQDIEGELPFERQISGWDSKLVGSHLLVRADREIPWELYQQCMHPVNTILNILRVKSELPTVLLVMPFLAVGGAEQLHLKIMKELAKQIRFVVVTFDALEAGQGTTADAFREVTPYIYMLPDFLSTHLYYSMMVYLLERFQPDTLYIANGATWIYDALNEIKSHYPRLRVVNQVYDSIIGWINRYDAFIVKNIEAHIGANRKICQAYIQKGVDPKQAILIEHATNPRELDPTEYPEERIDSIRNRLSIPEGKKVITFASRLHPQKRPMDFVELARRFSHDASMVFLLVGDGPLAGVVDAQILKVGLGNLIRLPFYRPISDILAVTDVLVLPSDFEGMPMIVIEAQMMGKPVVVTDVGNNREVLERTHGGVVIDRIGDVTLLVNGVKKVLDTPPDPQELREAAISQFDVVVIAQKYFATLIGDAHA